MEIYSFSLQHIVDCKQLKKTKLNDITQCKMSDNMINETYKVTNVGSRCR